MMSKNSGQLVSRIRGVSRPGRLVIAAVCVIAATVVAIYVASAAHCRGGNCSQSGAPTKTAEPAQITITPGPNTQDVDPVAPVMVKAENGTLTGVDMVNESGKPIEGVMTPDNTVWKPTVPLGYGRTYTLTVSSSGVSGVAAKQVSTFSTLKPSNQTKVSFTTTSEAALHDGGTYGVGAVIVAHFDEKIADRAAAERQLSVTTEPKVEGSWYWVDDQNVHWRPEHYYAPGNDGHGRGENLRNRLGRRPVRARRHQGVLSHR